MPSDVLTTARPLLLAVVAVVGSFIFALWLSQHRLQAVETNVYDVAANAEPSVVYLEDARVQLGRTGLYVDECVAALAAHLPTAHASRLRAEKAHARMLESLSTYLRLPFLPGEEALFLHAQPALARVDQAMGAVLDRAEAGELDAARLELLHDLHPDIEQLDAKLEAIVQHDTVEANKRLANIASSRRRSWRAAIAAGTVSLLLSALATTLATLALLKAADARRQADQERGARLAAEQGIRRRDEFLSLVVHELRTPLAALQLAVEALLRKPDRPSPTLQSVALRQMKRMEALVEELVLVAQLDLGSFVLFPAPVDLEVLARDRIHARASTAAQPGGDICVRCEAPVVGQWDSAALGRVIDELLSNAIRFGQGRPIDVAVSMKDGMARLVVRDRGIGIPPHRIGAVFERFERGVSERNYPGLGLGLYIARALVQAMGGTIVAASGPSEGATFTVELPIEAEPVTRAEGSASAASSRGTPRIRPDVRAGSALRPADARR